MWRPRWRRIEFLSLSSKIMTADMMSSSSIKLSREKSVNRLTSSNIKSSTSNGMKIFFRPKKRTVRLYLSWRTDTLSKSNKIDRSWATNCLWLSSSVQNFWTNRASNSPSPNRKSKSTPPFFRPAIFLRDGLYCFKYYRYQEAHEIQQICLNLEAAEREKYMQERSKKIIAAEGKLI